MGIALSAVLFPSAVHASGGMAEYAYTLDYNQFADIWWGANSDICAGNSARTKNCFILWSKNPERQITAFSGNELLFTVSIPDQPTISYALAQTFLDDQWVVYDLRQEDDFGRFQEIYRTQNYDEALSRWESFNMSEPGFVTTENLDDYFEQKSCDGLFCPDVTNSRAKWMLIALGLFTLLITASVFLSPLILLIGLLWFLRRRYGQQSRKVTVPIRK
jgi:hypothetical protein